MGLFADQLALQEAQEAQAQAQPPQAPPPQPAGPPPGRGLFADQLAKMEFDEREAAKNIVQRKAGEFGRGVARGGQNIWHGISDIAGDAYEGVTGDAEGRDNLLLRDKTEREKWFPQSSDSWTEKGGEMVGETLALPMPGLGAAKTAGGAVLKGALAAGAHAGILSEGESAVDRVKDAAFGATAGALTGGVLHGASRGLGKVSEAAKNLEKHIDTNLGSSRISGELPLGQQLGDDAGSKVLRRAAIAVNRGKKAGKSLDKSRRGLDDVYRIEAKESFEDIPGAVAAFETKFAKTRDAKKSFNAAKKVSDQHARTGVADPAAVAEYATLKEGKNAAMDAVRASAAQDLRAARKVKADKVATISDAFDAKMRQRTASGELPARGQVRADAKAQYATKLRAHKARLGERVADVADEGRERVTALERSLLAEREVAKRAAKPVKPGKNQRVEDLKQLVKGEDSSGKRAGHGRFSPKKVRLEGREDLAEIMAPFEKWAQKSETHHHDIPAFGMGDIASGAASMAMAPSMPAAAVVAALPLAKKASKQVSKHRSNRRFKQQSKTSGQGDNFQPNVAELTSLDNKTLKMANNVLTGNAALQKKYQALVESGNQKAIDDFLIQLASRSAGSPEEAM